MQVSNVDLTVQLPVILCAPEIAPAYILSCS